MSYHQTLCTHGDPSHILTQLAEAWMYVLVHDLPRCMHPCVQANTSAPGDGKHHACDPHSGVHCAGSPSTDSITPAS